MLRFALACLLLPLPALGQATSDPSPEEPLPADLPADSFVPDGGAAASTDAGTRPPFSVQIKGNVVLTDDLYLAVMNLPEDAKPDATTADLAQTRLEAFLKRSGYTLSSVRCVPAGKSLYVLIDEGQLEKVVFHGRLSFQMVRLKLALDLPKDIFNAPSIDRQLDELAVSLAIERPHWELERSENVRHSGLQLTDLSMLGTIAGQQLVHPQEPYELHVYFADRDWSDGNGLDVRSSYFDGLELGLNHQGSSLLWPHDRWRAAIMGGVGLRNDIAANRLYAFPSRALADLRWFTRPLDGAGTFRPYVQLLSVLHARQRKDLNLENYSSFTNELAFNAPVHLLETLSLFVGYGLQHYWLFGARAPEGSTPNVAIDLNFRMRTFIEGQLDWTFNSGNGRWDRRHAANLTARLYSNLTRPQEPTFSELRFNYQRVFTFGWNDVWVRGRGTWLNGDVLFHFEEPLGEHLRGVFGDVFVRTVGGVKGEFRFSLTRDLYKLGFFLDTAAYGELNRVSGVQTPRFGAAFGPSFHALIEGMFQLDLTLSFGFLSSGRFNTGASVILVKVFE